MIQFCELIHFGPHQDVRSSIPAFVGVSMRFVSCSSVYSSFAFYVPRRLKQNKLCSIFLVVWIFIGVYQIAKIRDVQKCGYDNGRNSLIVARQCLTSSLLVLVGETLSFCTPFELQ
jgi:hypothetical protein